MRIEGHLLRERLPENLEADREEEEDDEEEDVCLSSEIYLFIYLLAAGFLFLPITTYIINPDFLVLFDMIR